MKPPQGMTIRRNTEADTDTSVGFTVTYTEPVHQCPPGGSGIMPCCGRTPFEVPRWHRMTSTGTVTCEGTEGTAP